MDYAVDSYDIDGQYIELRRTSASGKQQLTILPIDDIIDHQSPTLIDSPMHIISTMMLEGYLLKVERGGLFAKLSEGNGLASSKEIGYIFTDAAKWQVDIESDVSEDEAALNCSTINR